ncbi:enoyl-CoA hydratase/isomerase family protein [Saccharopolyspora sp. 5N708]|uniref:enoyl-CoA hydratase/isomerase family protein n=1 Tax=Saccharopolyspora sp. 5N708 TaxID=3457424 RepID=UPI003FD62F12
MPHLTLQFEEDVAVLTLTNPPQNRLDDKMIADLAAALDAFELSPPRAVLLKAAGPDFCYGGEISTWPESTPTQLRNGISRSIAVLNRFENLSVPVVAAVQGTCLGGGFELAIRADVLFAGESAQFGHPEQTIGIVTLLGGIYRVAQRAGQGRAIEWALTSERIQATAMAQAGVVNHVVPDDELLEAARSFARRVAQGPTLAHGVHKALLRTWAQGGIAAADAALLDAAIPLFATEDVTNALPIARDALASGKPRPVMNYQGR